MIQNYEWFHTIYNDILAVDKKITQAKNDIERFEKSSGDRSKWTFEDKGEHSRLTSIFTGLQSHRASIVAEYNAKSRMANRAWLKSRDLPGEIQ